MFFIAMWVYQSIPPAIRSSRESKVEAAIAIDPLLTVAYDYTSTRILFYLIHKSSFPFQQKNKNNSQKDYTRSKYI